VKFAYADPPYPGQSRWLYADHPDYAGEVDHAELIARLGRSYPDGWALSTSAQAIRDVLLLCPPDARVAAWAKTNPPPIRTTGRWIWSWEPVIVHGGRWKRKEAPDVRDSLIAPMLGAQAKITGQKPVAFTRWILNLLGAQPGDTVEDLFAGSGAVAVQAQAVLSQPTLEQDGLWEGRSYAYRDRPRVNGSRRRAGGGRALR
jgi:hypothetical protein